MKYFLLCLFAVVRTNVACSQSTSAMTFNIRYNNPNDGDNWWELRKAETVKLINYYKPDFLGIQEGLHAQVEYIADNCEHYAYVGVGRDDGKMKGEYTALFYNKSRFTLIEHKTFWLSDNPDQISVGWDASMERICTYGHFVDMSTDLEYHIFNTHFDHRGSLARENSAKLIVSKIKEIGITGQKIIVMGDLNCTPESDPIKVFNSHLDDSGEICESGIYGPIGTFNEFDPSFVPDRRIDYIFSKNLSVKSYRNIDDRRVNNLWPSDHLPILAKFN